MPASPARPTRAQQRRRTEERILTAARELFADRGYDRTTIRAVAAAAGVDGGLVMHYFGRKDLLFARATEDPSHEPPGVATESPSGTPTTSSHGTAASSHGTAASPHGTAAESPDDTAAESPSGTAAGLPGVPADQVAETLLTSLGSRLTDEPTASLAVLRSMLTNADAAARYRTAAEPQLTQITEAIPTPDAALRASLLSAIVHGVIAERYLLRLTPLADASPDQIIDLLRPCFRSLATPPEPPPQ